MNESSGTNINQSFREKISLDDIAKRFFVSPYYLTRQFKAEISTYARVDDLTRKSAEEMRYLKELGWEDLVLEFETGDDEVLAHVNKGYTAKDILEGCRRLEEAGVAYRMIQLGGLAGCGRCVDSAVKTATLFPFCRIPSCMRNGRRVCSRKPLRGSESRSLSPFWDTWNMRLNSLPLPTPPPSPFLGPPAL